MLLVDCGNRALKCRVLTGAECVDTVFAYDQHMLELLAYTDALEPMPAYIASVADVERTRAVLSALEKSPVITDVQSLTTLPALGGVTNAYADYRQLGVDRWLTLLAADHLLAQDSMIVDAGTAITVDLLSKTSGHLGGAILPGFNTDRVRFRELFPQVEFTVVARDFPAAPGRSTQQCVQIGAAVAARGELFDLLDKWRDLLDAPLVLLCGQDAQRIAQRLQQPHRVIPDLVFQGMLQQIQLLG